MSSLIDIIRKRYLQAIQSVNPPNRWKIVIVDDHSKRLLNTVLKTNDILDENVTQIDLINTNRSRQAGMEAMYILMPTTQNIDRIIADFSSPGEEKYSKAHLFFIEGLPEPLFQKLTSSRAEPYLSTLKELFINVEPIEMQAFLAGSPADFFSFFSPPRDPHMTKMARDRLEESLRFTAKGIVNLLASLDENPLIRYYQPNHHGPLGPLASANAPQQQQTRPALPPAQDSGRWRSALTSRAGELSSRAGELVGSASDLSGGDGLAKRLAWMVQDEIDEYRKGNPTFAKPGDGSRPRGVLLITDRTMDVIAPFLHEFTYQAMCNDLLHIVNGTTYTYKFQSSQGIYEDKTATLSDADGVWTQVRHMHMREAIDKLMGDFNKFLEENAGFKGSGAASLNDMKDMLAGLSQYQEQREKFSLHLNIAQECMDLFEKKKLMMTGIVEQDAATGLTSEGKTPKSIVEQMVPLLDDKAVSNRDKVRIIALYMIFRDGVPDEDRRRLFQHARLTLAEQDAINALARLGARVTRNPTDRDTRKRLKQKPTGNEEEYELSRYRPLLQTVIEDAMSNKLDAQAFPYVRDVPSNMPAPGARAAVAAPPPTTSLRSARPGWKAPRAAVSENRQKVIVYVAGGMTYSEMRVAYQCSTALNKDIYIGSSHTVTGKRFVDDLKVLDLEGVGSEAAPNGLPNVDNSRGEPRSFQLAYDKRYFIKDAPPPPRPEPPRLTPAGSARSTQTTSSTSSHRPPPSPDAMTASLSKVSLGSESVDSGKKPKKKRGFLHF